MSENTHPGSPNTSQPDDRAPLDYTEAVAAIDPNGTTTQDISHDYENYLGSHDPAQGEAQGWEVYFVEDLDVRRAYGTLTGADAHLNLDLLDPATGRSRRADAGNELDAIDQDHMGDAVEEDGWS